MSSKKVFVLDPYHKDAIALLQSTPGIQVVLPDNPHKSEWHDQADGIILRSETRLTKADFQAASRLQVVVKQGVGVDNIDLEAAKAASVAVYNTPGLNSESVAELSLALVLSLTRRVTEIDRRIRQGQRVIRSQTLGLSLFQKTVGVVGMGNIGTVAAKKWIGACESSIICYDPYALKDAWQGIPHRRVHALEELLRESDVVTLHVPLLPTTRHMIGEREIGLLKESAILVNTARGGLVDENALLFALQKKRIWGAVLDATESEPPTTDTYGEFLKLDNVILTPHVGSSTRENQSNSGKTVVRSLLAALAGEKDVPGKLV
ncbi:d-3-phosphoglycerate dehydrogenase protein [Penicillium chermesinum]|uniref:D-3-phosphoglycerate dehydrogenase protein n=1 Tax=Penicillium chermesinum TaxID=63820 RepID=A0A9W9NUQ7_9EURO|nr:d-3-phosphoglycerate dehydrogenase protein [Penicillium chermesinum]KAJ5226484.1 d-3-phosphoglycerate dehydrogenase protein [Penicillium chermesinum]KAJ6160338.1 d-3-phosphoglycerate dehydrogenase protein [Penicillium chermesinum]